MIKCITIDKNNEWDKEIKSYEKYDVFYLSSYVRAFMEEEESNGAPLLLIYENEDDKAYNVVFRRDIGKDIHLKNKVDERRYYDLISPYGYGGFLGRVTDYEKLNAEYREFCVSNGYICEFVRFELFDNYYKYYSGHVETKMKNVVRALDVSIDELWMDFKQKVRKNVKKAKANGLQILIDTKGKYLDDFLRIYYDTMKRNDAKDSFYFSKSFFKILNEMQDNMVYFHVVYENKIISTELVIYGSESAYSYLGGTDEAYFSVRPNDFLKFEIIKWAKEKGLKRFVLGGGYGANDGIFDYKLSFAPNGSIDFYVGKNIFDKKTYDLLLDLREEDALDDDFFPKYRA